MSVATETEVPVAVPPMVISRMPGTTKTRYSARPPPSPAPSEPPKTKTNSSRKITGIPASITVIAG
ncbi:hypothetical protein [Pseudosporangium ferrugineum]|uniref:Uncharacterized protein n=1 Tax=Pseudosporangium ferrugineum TaxID=439699 RepID=A0A2T0SI32_9ACTN|nr:hypothetical protein CLV70_101239 [Pseudosporangium ferrugineum]